jgi:hypothetical protein
LVVLHVDDALWMTGAARTLKAPHHLEKLLFGHIW